MSGLQRFLLVRHLTYLTLTAIATSLGLYAVESTEPGGRTVEDLAPHPNSGVRKCGGLPLLGRDPLNPSAPMVRRPQHERMVRAINCPPG